MNTHYLTPTIHKVIAEYVGNGWMTMNENGDVHFARTAGFVLAKVRKADRKAGGFQVSIIEWRNVPDGFEVPE
jgi:hypothetical protein